jgi:hypothetical protein
MSRFVAYSLLMPVVLIGLMILVGRAPAWRSVDGADASAGAGGESVLVPEHVFARASARAIEPSGVDTATDESRHARGNPHSIRGDIDPVEPAYQTVPGWPGPAEAELRFRGEGKDPLWSRQTENGLLTMISQLDALALSRLEADCRESMCKLLLVYPPGIEPIYTIRQIYERADGLGLGPVLAETRAEAGELRTLSVFLRRRPAASSRR